MMPLRSDTHVRRWHWILAINWIAFDKTDCADRPLQWPEKFNKSRDVCQVQCEKAVDELVNAIGCRKITPIWIPRLDFRRYDSEEEVIEVIFVRLADEMRQRMLRALTGVIESGSTEASALSALHFDRQAILNDWPKEYRGGPRRRRSDKETREAYLQRISGCTLADERPTQKDDIEWAKDNDIAIELVKKLRREEAPRDWHLGRGRPKKSRKKIAE